MPPGQWRADPAPVHWLTFAARLPPPRRASRQVLCPSTLRLLRGACRQGMIDLDKVLAAYAAEAELLLDLHVARWARACAGGRGLCMLGWVYCSAPLMACTAAEQLR